MNLDDTEQGEDAVGAGGGVLDPHAVTVLGLRLEFDEGVSIAIRVRRQNVVLIVDHKQVQILNLRVTGRDGDRAAVAQIDVADRPSLTPART